MTSIDQALALRAFEQGFHDGADPARRRRRHQVDQARHEHYRRGHEVGRAAAEMATETYRKQLEETERVERRRRETAS